MIEEGIKSLEHINTNYSKFHQTMLYYNLFQCLVKDKAYKAAEEAMQHLITLDKKSFAYYYYEFLAEFYIDIGNLDVPLKLLNNALKIESF